MSTSTGEATTTATEHTCDVCGESFETEAALRRHVRERGLLT